MDFNFNHKNILGMGDYKDLSIDKLDNSTSLKLYFFMKRLRMMEEALADEYHPADEMRCPVHFCIGQEVAPAALNLIIRENDYLFCHHRSHGYYLAKNAPMKNMFAELYGKKSGSNSGRAGSQDISFADNNFFSGAILAGAIAIAIGTAMSIKMRKTEEVVFVGFGESATDEGIFWEAINYSALMGLPIIFICENNNYSVFSPQEKRQYGKSIYEKVRVFGVNSDAIFGNDAPLAYECISKGAVECRKHSRPYFLELFTARWSAHYGPENDDNIGYRNKKELDFWKKNCPIDLMKSELIKKSILNMKNEKAEIANFNDEIQSAFKFAKESPFPVLENWDYMNLSNSSPLADKLLADLDDPNVNFASSLSTPKGY